MIKKKKSRNLYAKGAYLYPNLWWCRGCGAMYHKVHDVSEHVTYCPYNTIDNAVSAEDMRKGLDILLEELKDRC